MCESCIHIHVPLRHILPLILETQFSVNYPNLTLDLCLVGTSLRKASLGSDLGNYSSQHLRDVLSAAYRGSCMYDRGNVIGLVDWERDMEATPEYTI